MMPSWADLRVLWDFSRPHTVIGSILAVTTFYWVACHESGRSDPVLFVVTLLAALAVNLYIVGVNQLSDVEIDRINKPQLPLPSGRLSGGDATKVVAIAGIVALGLSTAGGWWLIGTIWTVFLMGSLYSLEPARLKRFPVVAALFIVVARGVIGNFGLWLTFATALRGEAYIPGHLLAFVGFMVGFMTVISLLKDVPDIEGDARHEVRTFSVRAGPEKVMSTAVRVLSGFYLGMILLGLLGAPGLHGGRTAFVHGLLLLGLQALSGRVDTSDRGSIARFYQQVWGLYYLEFGAYLFACLSS